MYGYFDNPHENEPAYDPGLGVDCPVCEKTLAHRLVRTISLMLPGDTRSYFYRVHAACWRRLTEAEKTIYDSAIIDAVANSRNKN